jgi:hypothetical protein
MMKKPSDNESLARSIERYLKEAGKHLRSSSMFAELRDSNDRFQHLLERLAHAEKGQLAREKSRGE